MELLSKVSAYLKENDGDISLLNKWLLLGIRETLKDEDLICEDLIEICEKEFEKVVKSY